MKWDDILKLLIPFMLATATALVGGDKMSKAKIEKYDMEIIEMQKDMIQLKGDIKLLEYKLKHNGDD